MPNIRIGALSSRILVCHCIFVTFLNKRHARYASNSETDDFFSFFYRSNVWALCPAGYYLNGLRLQRGSPAFLSDINDGQCCRPQNHPNSYEDCYDEDVTSSFDTRGWSECQRPGYYMAGFYKSNCNDLNCIDKFRYCKMKKGNSILPDSHLH